MTRREFKSAKDRLEDLGSGRHYPAAGLTTLLSYEWETVEEDPWIIRLESGEMYRVPQSIIDVFTGESE